MDDALLVKSLQLGEESAFRELVASYQNMIISTCYGFLHNTEEAEDVAQEVFIQVFKSIDSFRGDAKLSTWLYRIAVNRSLNKIRSRKSKFFLSLDTAFEADYSYKGSYSITPYDSLENQERAKVLHEAIDKLPNNQKTAFVLSKYKGLPNKKISEIMSTTLSSVEALLNRAKKNLQKSLIDYYKN
jgi:RNA polymerase sigma-70 factor (ECF subfamily)